MADTAVTTTTPFPSYPDASAYLVERGYALIGTYWLRDRRGHARIEHMPSGGVKVIEGVA